MNARMLVPAAAAGVGLLSFVLGLLLAPAAAWGAYQASWLFWTGAALGGPALTASFHVTDSRWGRVVERIPSALGAFVPAGVVLLIPLLWSRPGIWMDAVLLAVFGIIAWPLLRGAAPSKTRSVLLLVGFFFTGAILALDLHVSQSAPFRSTVYPVLYLAGGYLSALGMTTVLAVLRRRLDALEAVIAPEDLLDLGNLTWGFALFLGYLWWCQYLPVWMTNIAREAGYHASKWRTWPWEPVAYASLALAVVVPGLLLSSRMLKKKEAPLAIAGLSAVAGVLLQRFLDVQPPVGGLVAVALAIGISIGFGGVFGLCYFAAAMRRPLVNTDDPKVIEALRVRRVKA